MFYSKFNSAFYSLKKTNNLSFQGVSRKDKSIGEAVVREIRGYCFKSSSALAHRYWCMKSEGTEPPIKMLEKAYGIQGKINACRAFPTDLPEYDCLTTGLANCGEMASMACRRLKKQFREVAVVKLEITPSYSNERKISNHSFVLVNFDREKTRFNISTPHTWGPNAMIVDPWAGIVGPAQQGVQKIRDFLRIQDNENLIFNFDTTK